MPNPYIHENNSDSENDVDDFDNDVSRDSAGSSGNPAVCTPSTVDDDIADCMPIKKAKMEPGTEGAESRTCASDNTRQVPYS